MKKKYITLLLVLIFLVGGQSLGLCLSDKNAERHNDKHDCCVDTSSPISKATEECLWHCASKKLISINIEKFSIENLRANMQLFLQPNAAAILRHSLFYPYHPVTSYPDQTIAHLNTSQTYFAVVFNHAPPL